MSLAAGIWAHYYFVSAWLPIAVGEIARQALGRTRIVPKAWLAMAAAGSLTAPLWPLASPPLAQRTSFWAVPTWDVSRPTRHITGTVFSDKAVIVILGVLAAVDIARRARARRWPRCDGQS